MKVVTTPRPASIRDTYPYIGRLNPIFNKSYIVLFTGPGSGTIIDPQTSDKVLGRYYSDLNETCFEIFHGTVTLSNGND